jgi:hypothetical protein
MGGSPGTRPSLSVALEDLPADEVDVADDGRWAVTAAFAEGETGTVASEAVAPSLRTSRGAVVARKSFATGCMEVC